MGGSGIPLWLLVVFGVGAAILVAVGSILLANRIMSAGGKEDNLNVSPFLTVVGLVYGALLGFTVVVSWQQFSSAGAVVASEASTLTMYGQTGRDARTGADTGEAVAAAVHKWGGRSRMG